MKISYNWLKCYIDVKIAPEKLGDILTMSGLSVASIEKARDDYILEIEVTSNRPDCLSVIGIAREVAAITGAKLKIPISPKPTAQSPKHQISIKVEDKKLCPRYTARVIRGVKVGESPEWLKKKVEAMGLRPVNNIVDITNFCLFETGEPMHAFDMDKISGKEVLIRRAKKGESLAAIDAVERVLDGSDLIISDGARPIAVAGVMGGLNTEVTGSTKNILLEAAYFDPVSVRRTSRRLGMPTESSYRFERKVDIENILYSSDRALDLILKTAGGEAGELYDIGKRKASAKRLTLRYSRLNKILGVDIPAKEVNGILSSLGLKAGSRSGDAVKLTIPHFRYDLQDEIDVIEEVARIYGYDKVPSTIPAIVDQPVRQDFNMVVDKKIRKALTSFGLDEIVTYSLLGKRLINMSHVPHGEIAEISNPLSSEQEAMRPDLLTGMLNAMIWNINRKTKDLKFFELGNIYLKKAEGKFTERKSLLIGMAGIAHSDWASGTRNINFFDLKGVAEALLAELGIDSFSLSEARDGRYSPSACAIIEVSGEAVGILGEVNSKVLDNFDIKDKAYALEADVDSLLKYVSLDKRFKGLPKYPAVSRDISIIVGEEIPNEHILSAVRESGKPTLKDAKLIDRYAGKQIPDGKVSLAYRLEYQSATKTLEEKEVSEVHSRILHALESKFGARLR